MNSVRSSDNITRRREDQVVNFGTTHKYLPARSPTLNSKKWRALNTSGLNEGLVGIIDVVIGGGKQPTRIQLFGVKIK